MTKQKKPHPTTDNGIMKSPHEDMNFSDDPIQKKSFVMFADDYMFIRKMPDPERLKLFDAIFKYHLGEDVGELPYGVDLVFSMLKQQFERNILRYRQMVVRNRINGQLGGRPRNNPENPDGFTENPKNPHGLQNNQYGFSNNPKNPHVTIPVSESESESNESETDSVFYAWQKEKFWIEWIDYLKSKKQFYGKNEIGQIKILYDDAGGDILTAAEILKTARRGNYNQWIKPQNGKPARGGAGSDPLPTVEELINSKLGR